MNEYENYLRGTYDYISKYDSLFNNSRMWEHYGLSPAQAIDCWESVYS